MSIRKIILDIPQKFWHMEIPGEAEPWKRAGGSGSRKFNPSAKYQSDLAWSVKAAAPDMRSDDPVQPWGIRLFFYSMTLTITDADNLVKNWLDALQGKHMCWVNDKQVREVFVRVLPHPRARIEALLYHITRDQLSTWAGEIKLF
jgi:Holliday junction resolvase RusA-like endonuclease